MPPSACPRPTVLFVQDGEPYEPHKTYLINAGYDVVTTDRANAIVDASTFQPDVIVLDFGSNGEVTQELKEDDATKHIPVVALVDILRD